MANYNRSEAYDYSYSAPARSIPIPEYETPQSSPKSNGNTALITINKSTLALLIRAARIFTIAVVMIALFAGILLTRINIESLDKEGTELENLISDAQSENTRLRNQLSSKVSREKVEAYATDVLGMHKLERYQVHYFEEEASDEAVIVNGKTYVKSSDKG